MKNGTRTTASLVPSPPHGRPAEKIGSPAQAMSSVMTKESHLTRVSILLDFALNAIDKEIAFFVELALLG